MSLAEHAARAITFSVGQTVVSKFLAAIQFAILVRLLSTMDLGAIGLTAGYLSMLGLLVLSPENVFVRDFTRIRSRLHDYISAFTLFAGIRTLALTIVAGGIGFFLVGSKDYSGLAIYFILAAIASGISSFTGPFREAFYANFSQGKIALVDLGTNVLQLLLFACVWYYPSLTTYGLVLIAGACIGAIGWYLTARKHLGYRFHLSKDWKKIIIDSIKDFTFWNQLSSMLLRALYQADVIILGFFVGLGALGDYTIALTIANVFFVIPQLFQKTFSVSFSRLRETNRLEHALGLAVKYNSIFSIIQWAGFILFLPWILAFFGPQHPETVAWYGMLIVSGVTLFNIARPWVALMTVKSSQQRLFAELYVWQGVIAIIIYIVAAFLGGVERVAAANIIVFGFAALYTIHYATQKLRLVPRMSIWSPYEQNQLTKWLEGFKKAQR